MEVSQQYISDLLKDLLAEQFLVVISEYKRPIDKKKGKTKSYV